MTQPPQSRRPGLPGEWKHSALPPASRTRRGLLPGAAVVLALGASGGILLVLEDDGKPAVPDGGTTEPAAEAASCTRPADTIVKQDTEGDRRTVVIEAGTDEKLDVVFRHVVDGLTEDAGYLVQICCTTQAGRRTPVDLLADGTYALGPAGAAATGLPEGDSDFAPLPNRLCPAR
ncbi:hypothetical protein [Streptomyces sp. YIM 98790]|uniref:hypothetical protein n=1 Tax=Streptomyces sp. YIM 98790 TaxID=2689077 RepID=UPI0014084B0E|nr:hypothetical protein [Streptomyces sp. YIM 98790]